MATATITNRKSKKLLHQLQKQYLTAKAAYDTNLTLANEYSATLDFDADFDAAYDKSEEYLASLNHDAVYAAFRQAGDDLLAEARNFSEGFPRCFQKDIATAFDAAKERHDIRESLLDLCVRL